MKSIVDGSVQKVFAHVNDPAHSEAIRRASFESALAGIRSNLMTYEGDVILPMIQDEIRERLVQFDGLTKE
jgi:hypothetical protein